MHIAHRRSFLTIVQSTARMPHVPEKSQRYIPMRQGAVDFYFALTFGDFVFLGRRHPCLPLLAQSDQHRALDGRMRRVLDLDPFAATPRAVAAVAPLGDDAFESEIAGRPKHDGPVCVLDVFAQPDASIGRLRTAPLSPAPVAPAVAPRGRGFSREKIEAVPMLAPRWISQPGRDRVAPSMKNPWWSFSCGTAVAPNPREFALVESIFPTRRRGR